jgi:hypothetical protein
MHTCHNSNKHEIVNKPIPTGYEWLQDVFTEEELNSLRAFYEDDGTFMCIGFIGPDGKTTQFAEPNKANAIDMLEKDYLLELYES